ncbi:MAG: hypothetical protein JWP03_1383 [Phycisphaerales bacterium]|nr:hypothetical protein [Phycisphaerales bacterium]
MNPLKIFRKRSYDSTGRKPNLVSIPIILVSGKQATLGFTEAGLATRLRKMVTSDS